MKTHANHLHYLKGLKNEELISLISLNDYKAFDVLIGRYLEKLKNYLHNRLHNQFEEDELMQAVMETAFHSLIKRKYREENRFEHWLMGIARNCLNGYYRERNANKARIEEGIVLEEIPAEPDEEDTTRPLAEQLLKILSPQMRKVVKMHAMEGIKHETIGRFMGINTNYVRQIYHRGLLKLKDENLKSK